MFQILQMVYEDPKVSHDNNTTVCRNPYADCFICYNVEMLGI